MFTAIPVSTAAAWSLRNISVERLAEVQSLTGQTVNLSDYANQRYVPAPEKVPPELMDKSEEQ
jgi:hypothetical protein